MKELFDVNSTEKIIATTMIKPQMWWNRKNF